MSGLVRSVILGKLRVGAASCSADFATGALVNFRMNGETESRSTAIPKILGAMKGNGSTPPEFEFDEDHSYFVVCMRVHPDAGLKYRCSRERWNMVFSRLRS